MVITRNSQETWKRIHRIMKNERKKSTNWILKPQKNVIKRTLKSEKKYAMADM